MDLITTHLPSDMVSLLQNVGDLAERRHVGTYAVGGFVRDLLLGIPNLDLDIVVEGNGIAFARAFARKHHARVKVHERFGTATVTCADGLKLDIATARTESYKYPTALPTIEPSSVNKDLSRRDFTINTLAIRLTTRHFGELVDLYGGQQDLNTKTIRVLHNRSFVEDPTRVFRAIRFEQRLGFRLEKETTSLLNNVVKNGLIHRLSKTRLFKEFVALLSEKEPRQLLSRMAKFDLLKFIHPQLKGSSELTHFLKAVERSLERYTLLNLDQPIDTWVVYWMALMDVLPTQAVRDTLHRLPFPRRQAKKLQWVGRGSTLLLRQLGKRPVPKPAQIYRTLCDLPDEALIFLMAKSQSESVKRQISAFLTTYQRIHPLLNGTDLKAMGFKPGPQFRNILEKLLDARLNGEVNTDSEERDFVRKLGQTS